MTEINVIMLVRELDNGKFGIHIRYGSEEFFMNTPTSGVWEFETKEEAMQILNNLHGILNKN